MALQVAVYYSTYDFFEKLLEETYLDKRIRRRRKKRLKKD